MQQPAVPFPILPTAFQICSLLAGLYPFVDIQDDEFKFRSDDANFQLSLQALAVGCCFLFLGYYSCQFVSATSPLRREYLGALALCTGLHAALAAIRAALHPAPAVAAAASTAIVGLIAGGGVIMLLVYDKTAEANPWMYKAELKVPEVKIRAARRAVAIATQSLWALAAVSYHLPYMPLAVRSVLSPHLGTGTVQMDPVYGIGGAVATDLVALARLWSFVAAQLRRQKAKNVKVE